MKTAPRDCRPLDNRRAEPADGLHRNRDFDVVSRKQPLHTQAFDIGDNTRMTMDQMLYWIGLAAVAISALTGVLDAGLQKMDLVGVVMVGCATALGGGTVRDILLDRPVFWISDQMSLVVALLTTVLTFFVVRGLKLPPHLFLIPDAIGLALFTIVGTQVALEWQTSWLVATLLGVITGVVGGVLRDVLCNQVPLVFVRGELYATAAWSGALMLVGLSWYGISPELSAWIGMTVVFAARLLAMKFRITLPIYAQKD